jgi:hypothetical protein
VKKIIRIKDCSECPFYDHEQKSGIKRFCWKYREDISDDDYNMVNGFPFFCDLEDDQQCPKHWYCSNCNKPADIAIINKEGFAVDVLCVWCFAEDFKQKIIHIVKTSHKDN